VVLLLLLLVWLLLVLAQVTCFCHETSCESGYETCCC
jgi:hypothetical protein